MPERTALYAGSALAALALVVSVFILTRGGTGAGVAIAAATPPAVLLGIAGLAARYPCRAMPLRRSGAARIIATHGASAAMVGGLWLVAWQSWLRALERVTTTLIAVDPTLLFGVAALLYLMAVAAHYLVLEAEAASEAEEVALRYEILAREAQLKAFKAQIDPHFLFNSLNAVASLCGTRPQHAREMAQLLADFFRHTLRLGGLERVTLAQEIDLVTRYLAIEKIRFGDRLQVRLSIDDDSAAIEVPPLLLQPLVENAVRHGISSMLEGGAIDVTASARDGIVSIVIENPADPDRSTGAGEGIGLENVRGRLAAFFDGKASLRAREENGRYLVAIEVPR